MSAPTSPSAPPRLFDPRRRAARLARAARRFPDADFLHRRAAGHMVQDLEFILRDFDAAVDVSAHPGLFEAVAREAGVARLGPVSVIKDAAVRAQPAAAPLPLADGSADLIVSVLSLHWADDLPGALAQIRRALKPDGLFLGALFGGVTLNELRGALTEAELEITGGAQARISPFADGFDGAALLQRAGFALPAVDVDRLTVRYPDLPALVRDLRAMGETSALAGPARPVRRDVLARAAALYAERHADPDGRIRATFEIIHLTGWAPHASQPKPARRGSATVRLADALNTREITGEEGG
ncbi:MAG: methyltransferase domain-containing protein [Brevundimonas sp.]